MDNTPEQEKRLKRIKQYQEEASKQPLIHQGWVCDHPDVKKVWFTGYTSATLTDKCHIRLEILFNDNSRHSIDEKEVAGMEGDICELLAKKGNEYLRNGGTGTSYPMFDQPKMPDHDFLSGNI